MLQASELATSLSPRAYLGLVAASGDLAATSLRRWQRADAELRASVVTAVSARPLDAPALQSASGGDGPA